MKNYERLNDDELTSKKNEANLIIKEYQLVLKINFPFQWGFLL